MANIAGRRIRELMDKSWACYIGTKRVVTLQNREDAELWMNVKWATIDSSYDCELGKPWVPTWILRYTYYGSCSRGKIVFKAENLDDVIAHVPAFLNYIIIQDDREHVETRMIWDNFERKGAPEILTKDTAWRPQPRG